MSLSARLAPHLPHLRRFASTIAGSRSSGDIYVAATLEILITDLSLFPKACSDRVGLYKLLIRHFNSVNIAPFEHATADVASNEYRAHQAFLLMSL